MKNAILLRLTDNGKQTFGTLTAESFSCKTLELPFLNNQSNISSIPPMAYVCRWTRSNRLSTAAGHDVFTYEVLNVPGRAGIRIHSGNYASTAKADILGCILLGTDYKDINSDGILDIVNSKVTVNGFAEFMNYEDFTLIIENTPLI